MTTGIVTDVGSMSSFLIGQVYFGEMANPSNRRDIAAFMPGVWHRAVKTFDSTYVSELRRGNVRFTFSYKPRIALELVGIIC